MQFLVPLLVEVSRSFWNMVAVHDVKDLVSNPLPVSCAFADEGKRISD